MAGGSVTYATATARKLGWETAALTTCGPEFDPGRHVHAAGGRMPRKSTYFTPKPRSGLLLADLD